MTRLRPCILAGPTASGKSGLALQLAAALAPEVRIEIISIDSAQVYKGMDIGTAKPSAAERTAVPHHGIDLLDPAHSYSAAQFVQDAKQRVAEVQQRGAWPWLVGGTMLYIKALLEGLDEMPAASPDVRAQLDTEAAALGWPALHAQLAAVDAITAARLKPTDAQRIQRALEVYRSSGRTLSSFHGQPNTAEGAVNWPVLALEPASRAWLHDRVAQRFDAMLEAGLMAEVTALRARGDLHLGLPSMRCVGYRQLWQALDAGDCPPGSAAWAKCREAGIAATRQLAKRQLTWLRSMPQRHSLAADAPDVFAQLFNWATQQLPAHA